MLIITIGRNPDNKIVVNDPTGKVGREHAEIRIQHNGYMTLRDNNSTNGTLVRGQRITPGQEIQVNRGDEVVFAGVQRLDWNQVPTPPDFSKFKNVYTVGRDRDNHFLLPDNRISRYHAVVLQDKNGKVFIYDQSSTGTTVNGQRIPSNIAVPVKKGDMVMFGNAQQLDWSRLGSGGSGSIKKLSALLGVLVLLLVGGALFYKYNPLKEPPIGDNSVDFIKEYRKAVGLITFRYNTKVDYLGNTYYKYDTRDGKKFLSSNKLLEYSGAHSGTGFLIKYKGNFYIVSNRHVADPAMDKMADAPLRAIKNALDYDGGGNEKTEVVNAVIIPDSVEVSGQDSDNLDRLIEYGYKIKTIDVALEDDLSIFQFINPNDYKQFKSFIDFDKFDKIENIQPGVDVTTVGYPNGYKPARDQNLINAKSPKGSIVSVSPDKRIITFTAATGHGASGSPVFNSKTGKLVGVLYGGEVFGGTADVIKGVTVDRIAKLIDAHYAK